MACGQVGPTFRENRTDRKRTGNKRLYLDPQLTPEDVLIAKEGAEALRVALCGISPRDERMIRLRYGIGCEPLLLRQCAAAYGVTQERARLIELRGLRHLRGLLDHR
jgi:DNA-directed RNA polymerase sigma subunit (sigma70/sigma32)